MKSDSYRGKGELTHPISKHPDGQPANISLGSGEPFHHTHPSDLRRFNREAEPVEIYHHVPEKSGDEIMSEAHREHAERLRHHHGGALDESAKLGAVHGRPMGKR